MKVAVIGTGLIGQAWAIVFARGGCDVALWDGDAAALDRAVALIAGQLDELQAQGLVDDAAALRARLQPCATLEAALAGVAYVQENLPEVLAIKRDIFARLDALAPPGAVLTSSTSSIPASAFTEDLPGRHRCLIAHPVNPPYLVPVVELCGAPWTAADAVQAADALMVRVGQRPVIVKRELEGFILNRLQGALLREAFRLVEQGYVDVDGLDATIRDGLGLRWAFMGPFETIDLNAPGGLADYCGRYGGLYQSIAEEQTSTEPWSPQLVAALDAERRALLPADQLVQRRLWRDKRLMQLARHKREAAQED
ncbi:3-hydroxyacyl-CoA dehydrogenase [Aquincola sp. MAHUQ-54]|uniref:3-hydroxyacyl-CoA dehydrogenase n=1 Tax=Aquincola agrisoli TaxID=3119538 RepID=A0AAW9Q5R7_9BURK